MELRLIVIRTTNPQLLADFYSMLGLSFKYHKHGNSPYHFSADIGPAILEIYPQSKDQAETDKYLRLGFAIDNFEVTIESLRTKSTPIIKEPMLTEFGFMAIVEDPDGRKIELYKQ
jgi:lactoylglutathione lyase